MKRVLFGLALVASALVVGPAAHAQMKLEKSVVANGGGPMTSATFSLNGTIGQPVIGLATSGTVSHGIGFWYPTELPPGSVEIVPGYTAGGNTLLQNFPNPFKGATTIRFTLAHRANVTLKVFSMPGQEIAELARGEFDAGNHDVILNDRQLSSGTYFYQLQVDNHMLRRQMIVAK
jgi:Secretion system C-terminal sorting domain